MNKLMMNFLRMKLTREAEGLSGGAPAPAPAPAPEPAPAADPAADPVPEGDAPAPSLLSSVEGDGQKPADPAPVAEPLTAASFEIPEGVTVPEETMTSFLEVMNNADLSPVERGQQLIALQTELATTAATQAHEAGVAAWTETQTEWQAAAKLLPEIGGEALPKTLASIKTGLKAAGATDETFLAMDLTGAGNHPEMIRVLHALTRPFVEAAPVLGDKPAQTFAPGDRLFGGTKT